MPAEELKDQGLRVVAAFLMRDVYGEIAIVFILPLKRRVGLSQITECRRFALSWMAQWDKARNKSPRHADSFLIKHRSRSSISARLDNRAAH